MLVTLYLYLRLPVVLSKFRRDQDFTNIFFLLMLRSLPVQESVTPNQWYRNGEEVRWKREEVCKVAWWSAQDNHSDVKRGKVFPEKKILITGQNVIPYEPTCEFLPVFCHSRAKVQDELPQRFERGNLEFRT